MTSDSPAPRNARRRSREIALQGVYQWLLARSDAGAIDAHLRETPGFDKADVAYFSELLHGVIRHAESLDAQIAPFLDRRIELLSPVEHAVLMIAGWELIHRAEVPYRVVLNEAVELAKTFGGTDGYKFVNGVLDKLGATLRPADSRSAARGPAADRTPRS